MKRVIYCLILLLIALSFQVYIHAEEPGSDITIGIVERQSEATNTRIYVKNILGMPLKGAAIFIENNGAYDIIATTDEYGVCDLYLVPDKSEELLVFCNGYENLITDIYRATEKKQTETYILKRTGGYQETSLDDVENKGVHMNHIYLEDSNLEFQIESLGMKDENPVNGDIRFHPVEWYIVNQESLEENIHVEFRAEYKGSVILENPGKYRLIVLLDKESYQDGSWIIESSNYHKEYHFEVLSKGVTPQEPDPSEPEQPKKQGKPNTPSTGDITKTMLFLELFTISIGTMGISLLISKKIKKDDDSQH